MEKNGARWRIEEAESKLGQKFGLTAICKMRRQGRVGGCRVPAKRNRRGLGNKC